MCLRVFMYKKIPFDVKTILFFNEFNFLLSSKVGLQLGNDTSQKKSSIQIYIFMCVCVWVCDYVCLVYVYVYICVCVCLCWRKWNQKNIPIPITTKVLLMQEAGAVPSAFIHNERCKFLHSNMRVTEHISCCMWLCVDPLPVASKLGRYYLNRCVKRRTLLLFNHLYNS